MTFNSFRFKAAQFKVVELNNAVTYTDKLEEAKRIVNNRRTNMTRYASIAKVVNRAGEVVYR